MGKQYKTCDFNADSVWIMLQYGLSLALFTMINIHNFRSASKILWIILSNIWYCEKVQICHKGYQYKTNKLCLSCMQICWPKTEPNNLEKWYASVFFQPIKFIESHRLFIQQQFETPRLALTWTMHAIVCSTAFICRTLWCPKCSVLYILFVSIMPYIFTCLVRNLVMCSTMKVR